MNRISFLLDHSMCLRLCFSSERGDASCRFYVTLGMVSSEVPTVRTLHVARCGLTATGFCAALPPCGASPSTDSPITFEVTSSGFLIKLCWVLTARERFPYNGDRSKSLRGTRNTKQIVSVRGAKTSGLFAAVCLFLSCAGLACHPFLKDELNIPSVSRMDDELTLHAWCHRLIGCILSLPRAPQ